MNDIPCKTCLIFPICKNKVNSYIEGSRDYEFSVICISKKYLDNKRPYEMIVRPKCSILTAWINEAPWKWLECNDRTERIKETHDLFSKEDTN